MKADYLFSLINPSNHARFAPRVCAVPCADRDYLISLNSKIFNVEKEKASAFINTALNDKNIEAWLITKNSDQAALVNAKLKYSYEKNMSVVGCFLLYRTKTFASVAGFGLLKDFRGKGLGAESIDLICGLLPHTVKELVAHTDSKNRAACALYKKAGFLIKDKAFFGEGKKSNGGL